MVQFLKDESSKITSLCINTKRFLCFCLLRFDNESLSSLSVCYKIELISRKKNCGTIILRISALYSYLLLIIHKYQRYFTSSIGKKNGTRYTPQRRTRVIPSIVMFNLFLFRFFPHNSFTTYTVANR